jgi:aspartyl-tRNA(Asn)/glutamyl-tRNA(Gln) amidotransferase subunit A
MTRPLTPDAIAASLARAQAANPRLMCFIDFDQAGAVAAAGALGPLQGLTGAIKGNIAVRRLANTAGSGARRGYIAVADADVVSLLRQAGACLLGTLNLHEGALGATTRNEAFGWCQNPWRAGYTPGGSSGGSGAAVAAGLVDFALGSDTLGSIRIPAAYCGVFGYKPGGSWLSPQGAVPLAADFDQIGPLARDAGTLIAVAKALGAPGLKDGPVALAGRRLGVLQGWETVPPAIARVVDGAMARLAGAGVTLVPVRLPEDLTVRDVVLAGFTVCAHEAATEHWAPEMADPASGISDGFRFLMGYGLKAAGNGQLEAARQLCERARAATVALLERERLDGLVSPTAPETAFPDADEPPTQAGFTCLANLAGLPSVSGPAGLVDGLPVGLMITGAPQTDALCLSLAQLLEPLPPPSPWW